MLPSKPTIQLKESAWWLESLGLYFISKETPEMAQQWKNRKHRGLKLNSPTTVMNDTYYTGVVSKPKKFFSFFFLSFFTLKFKSKGGKCQDRSVKPSPSRAFRTFCSVGLQLWWTTFCSLSIEKTTQLLQAWAVASEQTNLAGGWEGAQGQR